MSQPPLIELDGVGFRREQVDIFDDISWKLERGEHWAVLGPNGSGKTTLLLIAGGYLWPTSGVVRRLGQELVDLGDLRRSIGWVTANLVAQIPPDEAVLETVVSGKYGVVGLHRLGPQTPAAGDFAAARRVLEVMGCDALAGKPFGILSQGERQQALVARARMVEPLAIVLDEPCAGMDPGVRERFLEWLNNLAAAGGCALVFVTHHVEEIMPNFDRTLVMREGRVHATGSTAEVIRAPLLEQVYGVDMQSLDRRDGRWWPVWRASRSPYGA